MRMQLPRGYVLMYRLSLQGYGHKTTKHDYSVSLFYGAHCI